MSTHRVFVFDTSTLSCFARSDRLTALREICGDTRCVVTKTVLDELERGSVRYLQLSALLKIDWIQRVSLEDIDEIGVFAEYTQVLGSSQGRNLGEAATLAWADVHDATAIIDERAATHIGRQRKVEVHGTLWLLDRALKSGVTTDLQATEIVGDLMAANAWLPFKKAGRFPFVAPGGAS